MYLPLVPREMVAVVPKRPKEVAISPDLKSNCEDTCMILTMCKNCLGFSGVSGVSAWTTGHPKSCQSDTFCLFISRGIHDKALIDIVPIASTPYDLYLHADGLGGPWTAPIRASSGYPQVRRSKSLSHIGLLRCILLIEKEKYSRADIHL